MTQVISTIMFLRGSKLQEIGIVVVIFYVKVINLMFVFIKHYIFFKTCIGILIMFSYDSKTK